MINYVRHVLHSSSLYPLGTFWLAGMIVVPATMVEWLDHGHAAMILTAVAGVLVLAATRRDDRREARSLRIEVGHVIEVVDCQREALEARIAVLTAALRAARQGDDHAPD